jgi:hypothetical protein
VAALLEDMVIQFNEVVAQFKKWWLSLRSGGSIEDVVATYGRCAGSP